MIKVFIIDDSMFIRNSLSRILKNRAEIEVIGEASNPIEAMEMFKKTGVPDVFILDIEMPKMDGLSFLKKLKEERPIPVIIFASLPNDKSTKAIEALSLGAYDIVSKPTSMNEMKNDEFIDNFLLRIKSASNTKNIDLNIKKRVYAKSFSKTVNNVVAIGSSTGGVQTLETILKELRPYHPPIFITQHMPKGFTTSFANRLNKVCLNSNVKEAKDNDIIKNGDIFIAPGDMHLEIEKRKNNNFVTILKDYPNVSNHKPSVDVLFTSFAKEVKEKSIAFILTGMGKDGALGMKKIKDSGGKTFGQDKESSIVYGMPKVAFELGGLIKQVSLKEVIDIINNEK